MTIAITGATGQLGRLVIQNLLKRAAPGRGEFEDLVIVPLFAVVAALVLGKLLGTGSFNHVYELNQIDLPHEFDALEMEQAVADKAKEGLYAVKFLKKEVTNSMDSHIKGAADLVLEAKFLANLNHPNIVQLHALSTEGMSGFGQDRGYFLVLDRLSETLESRFKSW